MTDLKSSPRKIEILLVEDSETDRLLAMDALRDSRLANRVHCVENGEQAMEFLRQEGQYSEAPSPDLVLLDLNLPKKDGREVLAEIKGDELFRYIPVVVLTTSKADEDILGAYGVHANSYITKPLDFVQFGRVISALENFWFEVVTLPTRTETAAKRPLSVTPAGFTKPRIPKLTKDVVYKVLVVEDSPTDQILIKAALSESPRIIFETRCVERLSAAKQALHTEKYDIVISDLQLPDSHGVATVQRLVRAAGGIPVVVLTMTDDEETGLNALREGAVDYVIKGEMSGRVLSRTIRYTVDRTRIEEQMRHAQRMESLGVLAGGIAHDFNNLLMVIRGNAELQERLGFESDKLKRTTNQILASADRAATLTRQLLAFSRREHVQLTHLDFNELLEEFSRMIQRLVGPTIEFKLERCETSLPVSGDPSLLEQVLMNLVVNSRDAMPDGGKLVISTKLLELPSTREEGLPPGGAGSYVCMKVSDTGGGISPESLEHIFEPFYTTKDTGKGTGLGLSTAYGIVQQHRGVIEVKSEMGEGTEFTVLIPLNRTEEDVPAIIEEQPSLQAEGTILVVDDEEMVRELSTVFLETEGYTVIQAKSGAEVIADWEKLRKQVDLVITDLIMPQGVSGHDLGSWLYEQDPDLKTIYCSGFSQPNLMRKFKLREGQNFLSKPFSGESLLKMVNRILNE